MLTSRGSVVEALEESAWPGLVVLWACLVVPFMVAPQESGAADWALVGVMWLGFAAAAGLSWGRGWWWMSAMALGLLVAGGTLFEWLGGASYPYSDLGWSPFVVGSGRGWEYLGLVVSVGGSVSIAARPARLAGGWGRALLVVLVGLGYLWARGGLHELGSNLNQVVVAVSLTLLAVGMGDELAAWAAQHRFSRLLMQVAVPVVVFGWLLIAAGWVWAMFFSRASFVELSPPVDNTWPAVTLAAVTLSTMLVSAAILRSTSRRDP